MQPSDPTLFAISVLIEGSVQGVGYRAFAQKQATLFGLTGWVRNLADGTVEAEAEGYQSALNNWIKALWRGPQFARVEAVKVRWKEPTRHYNDFKIHLY